MKRRDLLAGLASVGAIGGAGLVGAGTVPDTFNTGSETPEPVEPTTLDTIEAPGSRDGEVTIPPDNQATFVDFFGTWCAPCVEQMPALGEAEDRIGDEVLFLSVTTEDVGGSVSEETVVEWWRENDGDWLVAADVTAELAAKLNVGYYPTAVALDATGRIQWSEKGIHTADEIVSGIKTALNA
ncbi:TlpA disulfide reductase family protein [Halomicrobium sp. LC1Hm]|uniref:TlpA family protein disulfide reductase n=1 Tax=Halomicrobium sp. LC1Hm TaxID=2610902 RepID=UPI0012983207|nr:TlpA disulfide reductase family protein [Halomicrobium sp. LC1Hm]QGA84341.1 Thioredoxin [Halomicrobium sp. LC1Hm]